MSDSSANSTLLTDAASARRLVRLPVEKPQVAVDFLHRKGDGVMSMIAHFWDRLAQTPPLARADLHLLLALDAAVASPGVDINISTIVDEPITGAMLYVPKAHRADILACDLATSTAFAHYIARRGETAAINGSGTTAPAGTAADPAANGGAVPILTSSSPPAALQLAPMPPLTDLSGIKPAEKSTPANGADANGRPAIDFLTGQAEGIMAMIPLLLPLVHKRVPARQLVNYVMRLPIDKSCALDPRVRPAKSTDMAILTQWRRAYRAERGLLFDADLDEAIRTERVFVLEAPAAANGGAVATNIVAIAKFDLELDRSIEIGGVYTFPEHRQKGYGKAIVADLAARIRSQLKTPILQVDETNVAALKLYERAGWQNLGRLARVWLTG